ncbi:MAG: hypothetical protein OXS33_05350 [bacterium]|nr:hypothetical protein [bacterium]MDE0502407.1 hypothetical protein [bacterium]
MGDQVAIALIVAGAAILSSLITGLVNWRARRYQPLWNLTESLEKMTSAAVDSYERVARENRAMRLVLGWDNGPRPTKE